MPSPKPANTLPVFLTHGLYRSYLNPGETVLVISDRANAGDLFQADAGFYFRIAGGFINTSLNSFSALPTPVIELKHPSPARERAFLSFVRTAGVGAIIVERAWTVQVDARIRQARHAQHDGGRRDLVPHRVPRQPRPAARWLISGAKPVSTPRSGRR